MKSVEDLRNLCNTQEGPYLRPFVPNKNWFEARVFVVGTNPATPLRTEFRDYSDYWDALTKRPSRFEEIYSRQHSSGASKSTQRARRFLEQLVPLNVLVTNAMIYPAKRPKFIPNKSEQRRIGCESFKFLFQTCRPFAILFYGSEAIQMGSSFFDLNLDPYIPISQQSTMVKSEWQIALFAFPHFSGQGVKRGYRVSAMDSELALLAKRIKGISKGGNTSID